ncbi:MAG: FixH family protein [Rickettsiales bacterium]|nr:FixH family protein [Rickettsiales bacterium]
MTTEKKSKIPYIFVAFFAVIFLVNFGYIYIAKKTWSGLVTTDSYKKGLNYNDTLKQEEQQKKLGWRVEAKFNHSHANKGSVWVSLKDSKFRTIPDAQIFIEFKRPAQEGMDFSRQISFNDGVYKTAVEFPLQGQWDFSMLIVAKDQTRFSKVERHLIQW